MIDVITAKVVLDKNKKYAEYNVRYGHTIRCNLNDHYCNGGDNIIGYLTESNKKVEIGDPTIYGTVIRTDKKYTYLKNNGEHIKMKKEILHTKIKRDFNVIAKIKPDDLSVREVAEPILKFANKHQNDLIQAPYWDHVEFSDINTTTRKRHVVFIRNLTIYLYSLFNNSSLNVTGKIFNKDHATIIHSKRYVSNEISMNRLLKENLQSIINECNRIKVITNKSEKETLINQHNFNICMI